MLELISWSGNGGISFFVTGDSIRGFKDLSISASAETEDSTTDGEKFIKKKNSGSYQINLTAILNESLEDDIKSVSITMTEAAREGMTGYFYNAGAKLFPAKFMMTDAKVSNIAMSPSGDWISCEVALTLKQCGKFADSKDSTKKSSKKSSTGLNDISGLDLIGIRTGGTVVAAMEKAATTVKSIQAAKTASKAAINNLRERLFRDKVSKE